MKKRLLSLFLTLCMMATLLPSAYARPATLPKSFTVTFDAEGGTVNPESKTVTNGAAYGELPVPTRSDYDFIGWYTEPSGGASESSAVKIEADTVVNLTEDQTLYAYWQEATKTFTVTFNPEGGTVNPESKTVTNGATYGELPIPTRTDYDFIGWYTEPSGGLADKAAVKIEADTTVNLTENQTLYAYWQENEKTFTVTFNPEGGAVSPESKTVTNGKTYGELPVPTRSDYDFIGWYTEPSGGASESSAVKIEADTVVNLTENQTLYAYWQEVTKTFTVLFDAMGGAVNPNSKTVTNGKPYGSLPTPDPMTNYQFLGWFTNSSGGTEITANTIVNLTENQTLYAGWKAKTFTVTFDAGGGTISTQSKTVTNGEPYGSLPAADKQGYAFIGWFTKPESEKDSSDNTQIYETTVVNLTDNQTLYAYWGRQYTVTFSDEGRTVTPSQMVVTNGDTYGSLPTPGERNGYEFLGWFTTFAGGVQIMPSTKVNLTDDQTLYAHWKAPDGTEILVHFAGNGSSVTPMSKYVIAGQEYGTLPVPDERYGYEFVGWYTSATSGKKVTETSQVANDAMEHTLYAHWKIRDGFVEVTLYANNGKFTDDSDKKIIVVPRNQPYGKLPGYPQDVFRAEDSSGQKYNFWGWYPEKISDTSDKVPVTKDTICTTTGSKSALYAIWTKVVVQSVPPTVTTNKTSDSKVTENSAPLSGTVNHPGSSPVTKRQIVYWNKYKPSSRYIVDAAGTDSSFQTTVNNFSPNSTYYYYAKAENNVGEGVGNVYGLMTKGKAIPVPVSISVSPSHLTLTEGDTAQLIATVLPTDAENRNVVWSSGDSSIATVDSQTGKVTAVKAGGKIEITATTEVNRLTAKCTLEVIEKKKEEPDTPISGEFDFSEANMATNVANCAPDGYDFGEGGNAVMATAYLARWDGPVLEENDPYPKSYGGSPTPYYKEIDADYHVQEILWIPARSSSTDNDEYKAAILNYGAVYAAFLVKWSCFDSSRTNYYYPESATGGSGGHAVAAVGWDDNYSADNFTIKPPGDGAFICRNSWGVGSGENGYFYVSYYDKYFGIRNGGGMVIPSMEAKTNYDTIYQYDPLGAVAAYLMDGATTSMYSANVFPQADSKLPQDETLYAASFYTYAKNTSYDVYVVANYQNGDSLSSLGNAVASGVFEDMGYHTVSFNDGVSLKAGTRFAVIVKLSVTEGRAYTYFEYPEANYASKARANAGESYMSVDGKSWTDLTTKVTNANFCIKAFTKKDSGTLQAALFSAIDNDAREYASDKVYSLDESLEAGILISDEYIQWRRSAALFDGGDEDKILGDVPSPVEIAGNTISFIEGAIMPPKYDLREEKAVTPVRDQGNWGSCWAFAAYASLESCLLKKAKSLSSSASLERLAPNAFVAAINQNTISSLKLDQTSLSMANKAEKQLSVIIEPSNVADADVLWFSSDESVAIVDTNGTVTAKGIGNAVITVQLADGSLSASCNVTVSKGQSVTEVTLEETAVRKDAGIIFLMNYTVLPENSSNKTVTWSSDNTAVVDVNPNTGAMRTLSKGKATVTVTTEDGNHTAKLTVYVDTDIEDDYEPGNVDGLPGITIRDAALVQQYSLDWDVQIDVRAANVDGLPGVTIRDAALIQQFSLDWDVTLQRST